MGVDPNGESYAENPYPHKRAESMPARHAARTYNKMMSLRMQPESELFLFLIVEASLGWVTLAGHKLYKHHINIS